MPLFKNEPENVPPSVVEYLVDEIRQLSDAQPDALRSFARRMLDAHSRAPGGMTIEVGTRCGGSALMFAKLLDHIYENPPPFITVDPYGAKPYEGGDHAPNDALRPYVDAHYVCAKNVLAPFGNHSHYCVESMTFFEAMKRMHMWWRGVRLPFVHAASFVFLDGNHDAVSITNEVRIVLDWWLKPNGLIAIDNALNDPRLPEMCPEVEFFGREWAIVDPLGRKKAT